MYEQTVSPINHSTASGVATTAVEAAKGGFWAGLFTVPAIGAAIGVGVALFFAAAPIFAATSVAAAIGAVASAAGFAVVGAVVGGIGAAALSTTLFAPIAGLAAMVGLVRGASKGAERVSQERGAATVLQAQVEAYKAQTAAAVPATTNIYAPSATNNQYDALAPQGSQVNMAATGLQAGNDNREYVGRVASAQLAAAKA